MSLGSSAWRLGLAVGFFALPVLALGALPVTSARAADGPTFDALANAYGVQPTAANASFPLSSTLEGSGPVAQAHLNSIGNSDAFASFPYPGDSFASLPGAAGGIFGVPIPAYPLLVATQAGDPPKGVGSPGISLQAASYPAVAEGKATVGADLAGFTSKAIVGVNQDQSVTAHAQSTLGLSLLNFITLSGVDSSATVTADPTTGELSRVSNLSIGQITVPGLNLTVPPGTPSTLPIPIPVPGAPQLPPIDLPVLPLPMGGELLPAPDLGFVNGSFTITLPGLKPTTFAVPSSIVLEAFKAQGIEITYEAAENNTTGVIAPALTFKHTLPAPPENRYASGPTPVAFTLGRSTVSVTLRPALAAGGYLGGSPTDVPSTGTGTASGGGAALAGADVGGSQLPALLDSVGAVAPLVDLFPTPVRGNGSVTGIPSQDLLLATSTHGKSDLSGIYLLFTVIAGAQLTAAVALKTLGVRLS